jgi:hypothetical protein
LPGYLWLEHDGFLPKVSAPPTNIDTTCRDQEVSNSETWIDKTEKPKKKKETPSPTPAPVEKEEPKKKKKKLVIKEVEPPKEEKKVVEEPKKKEVKKEVKKEINFAPAVGRQDDLPFEEIKARV